MQKMIICSRYEVDSKINGLLSNGWGVVPGTTTIVSLEKVRDRLSEVSVTPNNTIFDTIVSVVLEKR
ncbi:hypothetical protein H8E77_05095 [bacterium]|nr:hypothetical protein [bacterium]